MTADAQSVPAPLGSLWPAPARARLTRFRRPQETGYVVVPSARRPRLIVPADVRGADRMLVRYGGSRLERAARQAWRGAHRAGLMSRLPVTKLAVAPDPEGIESYLEAAVGAPVRIGVLLGPPRANIKPVVQIFDESGATIAFAKVGTTPLAAALVDAEASTLRTLEADPPQSFDAPTLIHHGAWRGMPIAVQGALSLAQGDHQPASPPLHVMVEIAARGGVAQESLGESDLLERVAPSAPRWSGLDLSALTMLHEALRDVGAVPFGAWHGDFGPWNMGVDGGRTQVWDWERFSTGVPVGFDAAHYRVQRAFAAGVDPGLAWGEMVADVGGLLEASGSTDEDAARAIAGAYTLAIVARYRADAVEGPNPALRRRIQWLAEIASVAAPLVRELHP